MSDTQTKRLITWRVQPLLLGQVDNAAKKAEVSRTAWLEWAVQNALMDAKGGVPDVPKPTTSPRRAATPEVAQTRPQTDAWVRQMRLNADKERKR